MVCGGEGGIRTLDTLPYTHFPGVRLRPLGHLSVGAKSTTGLIKEASTAAINARNTAQKGYRSSLKPLA